MKTKKILSAILAGTMLLTAVSACSESHTAISISDTLTVAQRYLSEMKYEQAIIEFDKILEVEPKNVEAYLGKAEAYIALGDTESAIKVLQEGYAQTGDERLKAQIDALIVPAETTIVAETTIAPETTTEETTAESEIIYDMDADPFEVENMLLKYIRGEGELVPEMLGGVTRLEIIGSELVAVNVGTKTGTKIEGYLDGDFTEGYTDGTRMVIWSYARNPSGYLSDISFLEHMPLLNYLRIEDNRISDLAPISTLSSLDTLDLSSDGLSNIAPLADLTQLRNLDISGNHITDLSPIGSMDKLLILEAYSNYDLSDISPLANNTSLEELDLSMCDISDISPLSNISSLKRVYLVFNYGECKITDVSPLFSSQGMEILWIAWDWVARGGVVDAYLGTYLPNCKFTGCN